MRRMVLSDISHRMEGFNSSTQPAFFASRLNCESPTRENAQLIHSII